jgi:hypothetical protein
LKEVEKSGVFQTLNSIYGLTKTGGITEKQLQTNNFIFTLEIISGKFDLIWLKGFVKLWLLVQ